MRRWNAKTTIKVVGEKDINIWLSKLVTIYYFYWQPLLRPGFRAGSLQKGAYEPSSTWIEAASGWSTCQIVLFLQTLTEPKESEDWAGEEGQDAGHREQRSHQENQEARKGTRKPGEEGEGDSQGQEDTRRKCHKEGWVFDKQETGILRARLRSTNPD